MMQLVCYVTIKRNIVSLSQIEQNYPVFCQMTGMMGEKTRLECCIIFCTFIKNSPLLVLVAVVILLMYPAFLLIKNTPAWITFLFLNFFIFRV